MTDTRGQDHDVAGAEVDYETAGATSLQRHAATPHAEDLVGVAVEMVVGQHLLAPVFDQPLPRTSARATSRRPRPCTPSGTPGQANDCSG